MPERVIRPFAEWLIEQRDGKLAAELGEALNALVEAVNTHQKQGTLQVTIRIKPAAKALGMVNIADLVVLKAPEGERSESLFFVTPDANLSRMHPKQEHMPLRVVPGDEPVSAKEVGE